MQGSVVLRFCGAFALAACVSACHPSERSTAGQTPVPSQTTMAQANSTAAPDQSLSSGPGAKYMAKTGADLKGVTFEVWANGKPIGTVSWPNKALDITGGMRGHANVLVIKWTRTSKTGTGTMTIGTAKNGKILSAHVSPSSPAKGQVSKTMIAPQAPVGRPHGGG